MSVIRTTTQSESKLGLVGENVDLTSVLVFDTLLQLKLQYETHSVVTVGYC